MLILTNEFGGKVAIVLSQITSIVENIGNMSKLHNKAKTIITNAYGYEFFVKESFEEVFDKMTEMIASVQGGME